MCTRVCHNPLRACEFTTDFKIFNQSKKLLLEVQFYSNCSSERATQTNYIPLFYPENNQLC